LDERDAVRLDPGISSEHAPTFPLYRARCPIARQSGLEFQRTLSDANILYPIIFISGHGDIAMSVGHESARSNF